MVNGEEAKDLLDQLDSPKCEVLWGEGDGVSLCDQAPANCFIEFNSGKGRVQKYACVSCGMKVSVGGYMIRRQML